MERMFNERGERLEEYRKRIGTLEAELAEARKEIAVARAAADWFRSELKGVGLIVSRQLLNRGQGDWAAFTSLKQKVQVAVNMSASDAARAADGGKG